ncbi:MAG: LysE family transporter [Nitrososphaerota archaeon]|nr:LysE family translocator [Candidatus Calditenuaceae archaeon]MDW8072639.1 LysE family transporter [Nitrososphaerota archaeon]
MEWLQLVATVVLVSASGALAPGPLLVATLSESIKRGPRTGLLSATGHMIVELPLVILIAQGVAYIFSGEPIVRLAITSAGIAALTFFGLIQVREAILGRDTAGDIMGGLKIRGGVSIGIVFTGLNPYFIMWWLTIGAGLVLEAFGKASWLGIAVLYASHVWIDYAWLYLASALAWRGGQIIGSKMLRLINLILGAFLIALAVLMSLELVPLIFP